MKMGSLLLRLSILLLVSFVTFSVSVDNCIVDIDVFRDSTCLCEYGVLHINKDAILDDDVNATVKQEPLLPVSFSSNTNRKFRQAILSIVNHKKDTILEILQANLTRCAFMISRFKAIYGIGMSKFTFSPGSNVEFLSATIEVRIRSANTNKTVELRRYSLVWDHYVTKIWMHSTQKELKSFLDSDEEVKLYVTSDPQPYRHPDSNDVNWDVKTWTEKVAGCAQDMIDDYIQNNYNYFVVNGDLAEYGREMQFERYDHIASPVIPLYGLGNHDYVNNVNDCTELLLFDLSRNACAIHSLLRLYNHIDENFVNAGTNTSEKWFDATNSSYPDGSFAYGLDISNNLHFIQAQWDTEYEVRLDDYFGNTINVYKSTELIKEKIKSAVSRNRIVLFNMHNPRFDNILRDFVEAANGKIMVFYGHTHVLKYEGEHYGAQVFNSGAIFLCNYIKVHEKNRCINISLSDSSKYGPYCF